MTNKLKYGSPSFEIVHFRAIWMTDLGLKSKYQYFHNQIALKSTILKLGLSSFDMFVQVQWLKTNISNIFHFEQLHFLTLFSA